MTMEVSRRLLPAGIVALLFHGALLSCPLEKNRLTPTPHPVQHIAVSLGVRTISRQPIEKQQQEPVIRQQAVSPAKPEQPVVKPAIVPKSIPQPIAQKTPKTKVQSQPIRNPQKIVPAQKKQRIVQLATAPEKTVEDHQPLTKPAQPAAETDRENLSTDSTPTASQVIQQATPLYRINPPPKYPLLARRRGQQGVVMLEALIDISGKVKQLKLFHSSGYPILDKAAMKAVCLWRFTPGTIGHDPHEMVVKVPVRFSLK